MKNPLLSIICITFNHENYISQCLEGFFMQKANFTFEVIIHDDASKDKTSDIIRKYENEYPKIIKAIYQTKNQFSKGINPLLFSFPWSRGRYIAICEGDDYWIDPYKIQKQVDFLEGNTGYGLVFTKASKLIQKTGEIGETIPLINHEETTEIDFESILVSNPIPTLTVMFRSVLLNKIDTSNISKFKIGDKFLWLEIAQKTKIGFLNENTAIYRVHEDSASAHFNPIKKNKFVESSYKLNYYFIDKYGCSVKTQEIVYKNAINYAIKSKSIEIFEHAYSRLKIIGKSRIKHFIQFQIIKYSILFHFYRKLLKFTKLIRIQKVL